MNEWHHEDEQSGLSQNAVLHMEQELVPAVFAYLDAAVDPSTVDTEYKHLNALVRAFLTWRADR